MPQGTKIATCSYCGTRAALVLTGKTRHELACSACGAPLHELKMLKASDATRPVAKKVKKTKQPEVGATPLPVWERPRFEAPRKKKKKKKSLGHKIFSEAFDILDDIFD